MNTKQFVTLALTALFLTSSCTVMAQELQPTGTTDALRSELPTEGDGPSILLKAPLFSADYAKVPIAEVNGDKILLDELTESLASMHEGMGEGKAAKKPDLAEVVNRLITTRLVIQEARNIELDKQPEFIEQQKTFIGRQLRDSLRKEHLNTVKADPAEIEKRYRLLCTQWTLTSGVFKEEKAAKEFRKAAQKTKDFKALLTATVERKEAEGKFGQLTLRDELHYTIIKELEKAKKGSISEVIPLASGFLVYRVDDLQVKENEPLKAQAKKEVETSARGKALDDLREALVKKHLKLNQKIIKSLDFEAKEPGIDSYLEDKRAIAEISGEEPITVGELAKAVKVKFFHGVEQAVKDKKASKVNKVKDDLFFEMTSRRAFEKEARLRKLDETDGFRKEVEDFDDSVLFGTFVEKVIKPDIKMSDEELNAYYEGHKGEYTFPAMIKLDGLGFTSQAAAQAGIDKLRQGMDFKWFKDNAEGRVDKNTAGQLLFSQGPVLTSSLDEDMGKSLAGVKPDEYRLYAAPAGIYYVLRALDVIPSRAQPYSEVEATVLKGVFFEKLNKALGEWGGKLRAASDVKVYVQFDK
jgi:hypothetical protein